mmetsp:Transcript_4600/g.7033  ORF Transcript_4600/g.7033 Transcript_4600/m.7033 type:complete len:95 (+) Transcript_4600:124-408(+)
MQTLNLEPSDMHREFPSLSRKRFQKWRSKVRAERPIFSSSSTRPTCLDDMSKLQCSACVNDGNYNVPELRKIFKREVTATAVRRGIIPEGDKWK